MRPATFSACRISRDLECAQCSSIITRLDYSLTLNLCPARLQHQRHMCPRPTIFIMLIQSRTDWLAEVIREKLHSWHPVQPWLTSSAEGLHDDWTFCLSGMVMRGSAAATLQSKVSKTVRQLVMGRRNGKETLETTLNNTKFHPKL